jgi:hypothetical protein
VEPAPRATIPGVAPGLADAVRTILTAAPAPVRRRKLLEALEHRGHRISLAGLNRALQLLADAGVTEDGPEGVRIRKPPG